MGMAFRFEIEGKELMSLKLIKKFLYQKDSWVRHIEVLECILSLEILLYI